MPKVSINIIKEWFKNQSKPPQEQFWAWLDSFWHKDEPIPMSAVTNLEDRLSKKADLVNGKIPKEQLPFTVETSEIIALGAVTATSSTVSLAVHSSGSNKVRLGGNIRERAFASNFNYTPVVTGVKVLVMYAIDDEFIFYLAEGIESAEAVEPELPSGALYIRRIIVNVEGPVIDAQVLSGFREKAVDGWKTHFASSAAPAYLVLDNSHKCNFSVVQLSSTSEINLAGISSKVLDWLYDGLEFTITNDCATDINLVSQAAGSNQKAFILPRSPFKIKSGQSIKLYYSASQDAIIPLLLSSDAQITFATQPEMESQTPPDTENNKAVSLFGLWKWLQKLTKLYITPTTGTALERYRLRVRQSNGRLAYVGADDIERDIAWSSDINTSNNLLIRHTHNINQELYPTAFDVATGNITVPNHGLTVGVTNIYGGVIPNAFKSQGYIKSSDWKSIPYEWTDKGVGIKVIDANTLQIADGSFNTISINNTSTENNGNIDFTKWHIELFSFINMPNIPIGFKNVKIRLSGYINTASQSFPQLRLFLFDSNGNVFNNLNLGLEDNTIGLLTYVNLSLSGSYIGLVHYTNTFQFSVNSGLNPFQIEAAYIKRGAGASSFPSVRRYSGDYTYITRMLNVQANSGFARLAENSSLIFNGSVIEIYKS